MKVKISRIESKIKVIKLIQLKSSTKIRSIRIKILKEEKEIYFVMKLDKDLKLTRGYLFERRKGY